MTGPWFNIKIWFYGYRKFHCGDKSFIRSSISTMRFPLLARWHDYIEWAPGVESSREIMMWWPYYRMNRTVLTAPNAESTWRLVNLWCEYSAYRIHRLTSCRTGTHTQNATIWLDQGMPGLLRTRNPPVGSGTPAFRLGSRINPHRHRGVVKVHWRVPWVGGLFSWVVATFTL